MPGYVTHFAKIYPEIAVQVLVEQSEGLEKRLLHNELDFAILEGAIHEAGLIGEEYMEDSLQPVTAVGKDFYPWQVLSPQEFQQQPFLLREKGSGTREIFDRLTGEAGFFIQPSWESASNTALIRAAASGLGIAVLSGRLVEEQVQSGKLCPVQLEGLQFRRQFRMVYHQNKYLSQAAREFMAMCRDEGKKKTIF